MKKTRSKNSRDTVPLTTRFSRFLVKPIVIKNREHFRRICLRVNLAGEKFSLSSGIFQVPLLYAVTSLIILS